MKKSNLFRLILALMLVLMLSLVACNKSDDTASKDKGGDKTEQKESGDGKKGDDKESDLPKHEEVLSQFSQTASNTGEPLEDGELNFGLVSNDPFKGTLNWNFYSGAPDAEVIRWFDESLLGMDGDFLYDQTGPATFEHDESGKVFTFKLREGIKWHDGEPLTVEDWVFAHEVIAHPDYTGVRFDETLRNIEGIEEYHNGEAETISGLEIIDDHTLKMTFKEATPSLLAGGIWTYALPKHIFKDIPVKDMESSDAVRKNPIGIGPYKVESIVPGESVVYTRNEDYWRGRPALAKVTLKVVAPSTVAKALETGEVDMVDSFSADQYPDNKNMENVEWLASIANSYNYIGFKLGEWDFDKKEVKPDPNKKMADPALRQAMAHAIDGDAIGEKFYNNIYWGANSLIDPGHRLYYDHTWEGFDYDLDKANKILDEAGYTERDADGFRKTPDGEELVINFAGMDRGDDISEPLAQYYLQQWKEIGLNVQLIDGRLLTFEDFYDRVGNGTDQDDPNIDVYAGGWGTGSNVDPSGLYGRKAKFNFTRYASEENDRLLAEGLSEKSFDLDYRRDVYKQWHELMIKDVPAFAILYRLDLTPVNKRVTNYSVDPDSDIELYQIGVTEEEPIKAK